MFESKHTSIEWGDHCHPNEKFGLGFGTSDSKAEKAQTGQNVFGHKISLRGSNFNEKNQHAVPDCSNASFVDFRIIPLPTPSKSGMFGLLEVPPVILSFSRSLRKSYLRMNISIWQSNFHLEIQNTNIVGDLQLHRSLKNPVVSASVFLWSPQIKKFLN